MISDLWNGPLPLPRTRTVGELRPVLADPGCGEEDGSPVYWMYRRLARTEEDRKWLEDAGIRYDITVIPPGDLCGECVKTRGHYHSPNPAGVEYPEVYELLMGTAWYLLQDRPCTDLCVVEARPGDQVVIPPGYGHITINPGGETLIMANLVAEANQSEYAPIERLQGGGFYAMTGGWVKNPRYPEEAVLRWGSPAPIPGAPAGASLYDLVGRGDLLGFLTRPEDYPGMSGRPE